MEELFKAVRGACSAGTWSQAVELVRLFSVNGESVNDDEIVCRVKVPGRVVPRTVQLYPNDEEWACDCDSRAPCCEHVAASVIAVRKARAAGEDLPRAGSRGARLIYRFVRHHGELSLERVLLKPDGAELPLTITLASAVATKRAGFEVTPSQQDLNVDRVLGQRIRGPLPVDHSVSILKLLAAAKNVEFEGKPVHVGTEVLKPIGTLSDENDGYALELSRDPRITEVVASGVALAGDTLHLLDGTRSAGAKLEKLPSRKHYPRAEAMVLVTEVLPAMSKRFKIDIRTAKLPKVTRDEKPRALLDVEQEGGRLTALLTLVYGTPPLARVDGDKLVHLTGDIPLRDEKLERHVIERARQSLGMAPGTRLFADGDAATALASRLDRWRGEIRGTQGKRFIHEAPVTPRMHHTGGQLVVHFESAGTAAERDGLPPEAPGSASAEAVLRAWQEGHGLVPLLSGGWAPLPEQWLAEHAGLLAQVLSAREHSKDGDKPPGHTKPALLALCDALDYPAPAELEPLRALLRGQGKLPTIELPADLRADLRAYQRQGVNWLGFMRDAQMGAVLADDMGLGKTLQALCVLEGRCLVVCPTSVVHNWAAELGKFRPDLTFSVYQGKDRALDPNASVTLTSYALLRLDQPQLQAVDWDIVVLDEAQMIKNPGSQVAQAAYTLRAGFKLTLTGTPVENRLEELWSQFHFTNPGLLGGRAEFQARYSDPVREGRREAAVELRKRIGPFLLRRDKRTVAPELPPRTDIVLHCELSERERVLYDALRASTQKEVVEKLRAGGNVMQALEALLRLRQASCHSALIPGQHAETSAKTERLLESLDEASADGHKALVFSQWTSLLDLLEPHLTEHGLRFSRLDGSTRDRQGVVDEFQTEAGPEVLLLSLKAGGTGLNLTAADHVFLLDPWWNPAVEQQAADRAHRIGQDRPVFVHRLIAKNTVEERILALQQQKRDIAATALEDAAVTAGLTKDDLLALLEG
jgi:superfamily II DNA or RNA helicase